MKNKFNFKHNQNTNYFLIINNKKVSLKLKRIKLIKNYYKDLIKPNSFPNSIGYFIYNEKGFNSFLFNDIVDIIFTDNNNSIIFLKKNFIQNKTTNYYPETKFIYILPKNTIAMNGINLESQIKHSRL